ncbi:MAG: hypothetical protein QMC11_03705, partial [Rhodospirillales bacterium]
MRLNALIVWRKLCGPTTSKSEIFSPRPMASAELVKVAKGRFIRRSEKNNSANNRDDEGKDQLIR